MVAATIFKTYHPTVVDGIFFVTTYDLPEHWEIRVVNGKTVTFDKVGHDLPKLNDVKTRITIKESATNFSHTLNNGSPVSRDFNSTIIKSSRYDTVVVKMTFNTNDQKSPDVPHDRILVLDQTKFYVDSNYLALWSKYFDLLFNGDFAEKDAIEIKVEEVDPSEFDELLKVIGPTKKEITGENVVFLWKLADRFDIPTIAAMCEQFLFTPPGAYSIPLLDKLNVAIDMKSEKLEQSRVVLKKMDKNK